jgi:hypothetical protein
LHYEKNDNSAWTICTAVPLVPAATNDDDSLLLGPFREYRVELGICAEDVRLRVKFDYSIVGSVVPTQTTAPPPLELKTMTVCREAANVWPRSSALASSFFDAPPGAAGGLYDPPPINEQYASQYCMVDMEGGATALFPVRIDQNVEDSETEIGENGNRAVNWITSLDWTAGAMRYQVDRKSHGGVNIRGLKTLELSEVQSADADQYRPRDGGQDMRQ